MEFHFSTLPLVAVADYQCINAHRCTLTHWYTIYNIYNIIIQYNFTIGRVFIAIADTRAHMHVPTGNKQDDIIIAYNDYKHIHAEVYI